MHSPSNDKKGTPIIRNIIKQLFKNKEIKERYTYIETKRGTAHEKIENLKQITTIYIDQFFPKVGAFGVTSIEALSYSCIVFACYSKIGEDVFQKCWQIPRSQCAIIPTSKLTDKFLKRLIIICNKSNDELQELMTQSHKWYLEYMSATRFVNLFDNQFN